MKNLFMTFVNMSPINLELKNVMYKSHMLPHIVANNTITNLGFFFKSRTLSLNSSFVPFFSLLNGASVVAFSASSPNVHWQRNAKTANFKMVSIVAILSEIGNHWVKMIIFSSCLQTEFLTLQFVSYIIVSINSSEWKVASGSDYDKCWPNTRWVRKYTGRLKGFFLSQRSILSQQK